MSNTDATPSWSGYIFQGEVALCKAIEKINELDNVQNDYCLRLEQDEDFSIKVNDYNVFQVKAYLSNNSDRTSKYKNFIEELINKYYYSIRRIIDPDDKRKRIPIYSINKRKQPIRSSLITHSEIIDYDNTLNDFHDRYKSIDFNYFSTIHGSYTLDNINTKLDDAISSFHYPKVLTQHETNRIRNYCCQKISDYIKQRHLTNNIRTIPFEKIISWINQPRIDNEDFVWFQLEKVFTDTLLDSMKDLDINGDDEKLEYEKLEKCLFHLERLSRDELQSLIYRVTPHKDHKNLVDIIDGGSLRNIILKSIRKILIDPKEYSKLHYYKDEIYYQLSTINENPDISKAKQRIVERIKNNSNLEIDFYINEHLDLSKQEIYEMTFSQLSYVSSEIEEEDEGEKLNEAKVFGLINVDDAIEKINE